MNREKIYKFIEDTFEEYSFDRMCRLNSDDIEEFKDEDDFPDYTTFLVHNRKCIDELPDNEIIFLEMLIDRISKNKIRMCDEEDFGEWKACSIYFNADKQLVMMHPR